MERNKNAGWKLVPVEPTNDMRRAFHRADEECEDGIGDAPDHQWHAMLAAAQQPAPQPLTDERLLAMWSGNDERALRPVLGRNKIIAFARAIERAHGIKEQP